MASLQSLTSSKSTCFRVPAEGGNQLLTDLTEAQADMDKGADVLANAVDTNVPPTNARFEEIVD